MLSSVHDMLLSTWTYSTGVTCTRPAQDQSCQNSGIDGEGSLQTPFLTEEILAVDRYWGRKSHPFRMYGHWYISHALVGDLKHKIYR